MTWNYRVIRHKNDSKFSSEEPYYYAIHEVYYDKKGRPNSVSINPTTVSGDSLSWILERMLDALNKPVLDYDTDFITGESNEQKPKTRKRKRKNK